MPDDGSSKYGLSPEVEELLESSDGSATRERIDGVVVGALLALDGGQPLVRFPGASPHGVPAASTRAFTEDDIGRPVAVTFIDGDPARPLVLGPMLGAEAREGDPVQEAPSRVVVSRSWDRRDLVLEGDRKITLKCGHSSITLTREGRIEIRGRNLLSRADVVNRIRGGVVHLN